jgi:hypothetical protein
MSSKLHDHPDISVARLQYVFRDDFGQYTDTAFWTKAVSGGSVAIQSTMPQAFGGSLLFTTGAGTNDYAYIASTNKILKWLVQQPIFIETQIIYTEQNTNKAMIYFGLVDTANGTILTDTTGLFNVNTDGALIYKTLSDTYWRAGSVVNGATAVTAGSQTLANTTYRQRLGILMDYDGAGNLEISYFVNDRPLLLSTTPLPKVPTPIKHVWDVTTTAALSIVIGNKAGSTTSELLNVDYVAVAAGRHQEGR